MAGNHEVAYFNNNCVKFIIWHTLRKLPAEEEVTRTVPLAHGVDTCILTHDWKVHLDVIEGDPRPIIAYIQADFGPSFRRQRLFVWNRPRKTGNTINDGGRRSIVWRCFESRQKCAGTPPVLISIVGMGGTVLDVKYHPDSEPIEGYFQEKCVPTLGNINGSSSLLPIPLPPYRAFSLEHISDPVFSVGSDSKNDTQQSAPCMRRKISWESGEDGIRKIRQSLVASTDQNANESNTKMVDIIISIQLFDDTPNDKNLENMMKLSQNFIKYEEAMDNILHINRESRIQGVQTLHNKSVFVKSNKYAVEGNTNRMRHDAITSCSSNISDLVKAMNPQKNVRYKLMFAREEKKRNFAAQFFFHAVPDDLDLVVALLRFCTFFVHNSFRFQKPKPLKSSRSIGYEINFLFSMVIRDRVVEETLLSGGGKKENEDDSSLCLYNFDIDGIDDDDDSIPVSVTHGTEDEDEFSNFSGTVDRCSPDRKRNHFEKGALIVNDSNTTVWKRPRLFAHPSSNAMKKEPSIFADFKSLDVDVVFRSHLYIENKHYTASRLAIIGKKLSTGTSNSKTERLEKLKSYFNAREDELKKIIGETDNYCNSGILGVEFVFKSDVNQDDNAIRLVLRGGRKMTLPRRSVCKSKNDFPLVPVLISEAEAKTIFEKFYGRTQNKRNFDKDYIDIIYDYIDHLHQHELRTDSNSCQFALIHDLLH